MVVALVRHGRTEWNVDGRIHGVSDVPLDATGHAQAAVVAERFAGDGTPWSRVISSPLLRAHATAEAIAARLGLALDPWPEWVEQDYGLAEGRTGSWVGARWPAWDQPGKEHDDVVTARGLAALDRVHREYPGEHVIVVSHGTIIRYALQRATGRTLPDLGNTGVWLVAREGDGWTMPSIEGYFE